MLVQKYTLFCHKLRDEKVDSKNSEVVALQRNQNYFAIKYTGINLDLA
jgi:hypothetical protein